MKPGSLARPLGVLFFVGMVLSLGFRPELPSSLVDVVAGIAILSAAFSCSALLIGCAICGADGEVYHPRWSWLSLPPRFKLDASDMITLPRQAQDVILTIEPAVLATAAGITTWNQPDWSFFPLLGLILSLRPILGGRFAPVVRLGHENVQSDAAQAFLFPPNRGPKARWRALGRALRQANTWVTVAYGVIWTLFVVYLGARLTDTPPWTFEFWEANGVRVAAAIGGSLALLAVGFVLWEAYQFIRERATEWQFAARLGYQHWFGGKKLVLDETERLEAIATSPLLRLLGPPQRQQLVRATQVARYGPWHALDEYEGAGAAHVGLIVSGRVGLRRQMPSGRRVRTQILEPGDVIGLHDFADPEGGGFDLRTLTPVTLLTLPREQADEIFVRRLPVTTFTNVILKLPFLRGISLCQNWHMQAIERFAALSSIIAYPDGCIIFGEEMFVDRFFITFEGEALVTRYGKKIAIIRAGEFFGEIGMMQSSAASATITAHRNTRCLAIARKEFMRFVTHNYTVALEVERVSSWRLRRPLFPLRPGDFPAT